MAKQTLLAGALWRNAHLFLICFVKATLSSLIPIFFVMADDWRWEENNGYEFAKLEKTYHLGPEGPLRDSFIENNWSVDFLFSRDVALLALNPKNPELEFQKPSRTKNVFIFLQSDSQYRLCASIYVEKYVIGQNDLQSSLNIYQLYFPPN